MASGHIFVSYCSTDWAVADDLVRQIEATGCRVWYAPRDVRPGTDYSEQIQTAIERADAFVVIISKASNESDFVRAETEMAFSRRRPIFPVRAAPVAPAPGLALFLQLRHWTDVFGPSRHNAAARLASELVGLAERRGRGPKRAGKSIFRRPLLPGPGPGRSRAVIALALAGSGALLLCVMLVVQRDGAPAPAPEPAAKADSNGNAGTVQPASAQPNMNPLVETWARYDRETTPPPEENILMDNGATAANDAAAALNAGNAVNGM